jgi:hypothetical protein
MGSPTVSKRILTVSALCALLLVIAAEYGIILTLRSETTADSVKFGWAWHYIGDVLLSGQAAWQVCAALGVPCPSNPIYTAREYVSGLSVAYVVVGHLCEVPNGGSSSNPSSCNTVTVVLLDSAAYCTTAQVPWLKQCPATIN